LQKGFIVKLIIYTVGTKTLLKSKYGCTTAYSNTAAGGDMALIALNALLYPKLQQVLVVSFSISIAFIEYIVLSTNTNKTFSGK
jgi:hypothetical protein